MANPFSPRPPLRENVIWQDIKRLNKDSTGAHFKQFSSITFEDDSADNLARKNLIVVPGFADDIEIFTPLTSFLTTHFEQKNISVRVCGFTPPFQGSFENQPRFEKPRGRMLSFKNHYLEPLDKLISSTTGEKPYLVGHSTGGTGIVAKILEQPQLAHRLQGVVLIAPFFGLSLPNKPRVALQKISSRLLPILDSGSPSVWQRTVNALLRISVGLPNPLAHATRSLTAGIYQHELAKKLGLNRHDKEFFLKKRDLAITGEWMVKVSAVQNYIAKISINGLKTYPC